MQPHNHRRLEARAARRPGRAAGVALCVLACPFAWANPGTHVVASGDTLYELARRYSGAASEWPALQRLNGLNNPRALRPGSRLRLPDHWAYMATAARLEHLDGQAWLTDAQGRSVAARTGASLHEGQWIRLDADSHASLLFADGSRAHLSGNTRMRIDTLRASPTGHTARTRLQLDDGRVDSAIPRTGGVRRHYEIRTPYAVASVRGTRFGVSVVPGQLMRGEVYVGAIEWRHAAAGPRVLVAGEGSVSRADSTTATRHTLSPGPDPSAIEIAFDAPQMLRVTLPPLAGEGAWHVRIGPADQPEATLRAATTAQSELRLAALSEGRYVLQAQRVDAHGLRGQRVEKPFDVRHPPEPPLLTAPAQGEKVSATSVELRCSLPVHADGLRLQVTHEAGFAQPLINDDSARECTRRVALPPGSYHWRVASLQRGDNGSLRQGPFSAIGRFEVLPPLPASPQWRSHATDGVLQLHWSSAPESGWRHRVQIAQSADFKSPLHALETPDAGVRVPGLPPGRYFIRLQAVDAHGQASPFSAPQTVDLGGFWRDGSGHPLRLTEPGAAVLQAP